MWQELRQMREEEFNNGQAKGLDFMPICRHSHA